MQELYATSFEIFDVAGGDAFDVAVTRARAWLTERMDTELPDFQNDRGSALYDKERELRVRWWFYSFSPFRVLEFRFSHPDSKDPGLIWHTSFALTDHEGATRVTTRLQAESTRYVVRPTELSVRPPNLIRDILSPPLEGRVGYTPISPSPNYLTELEVADFVERLQSLQRILPIFYLSHALGRHRASRFAAALCGVASIVMPCDTSADGCAADSLASAGLDVPRDGARLFWPSAPLGHTMASDWWWDGEQPQGRSFLDDIVRKLAAIATGRVPVDPRLNEARRASFLRRIEERRERDAAQRQKRREERERLRRATEVVVASSAPLEAQLSAAQEGRRKAEERADAAEEKLETVRQETIDEWVEEFGGEDLKQENADLRDEIEDLKARVRTAEANVIALSKPEQTSDDAIKNDVSPRLESWDDIGQHLARLEHSGCAFTERARTCYRGNRYPHIGRMWEALGALSSLSRHYNDCRADLGERFEECAVQFGLNIALTDGSYTDHEFEFEGVKLSRLPHVKIDDAKSPNEVGRIYFALDPTRYRLVVDWFGTKPDRPGG